jgi:virulence factor Mce-like protein
MRRVLASALVLLAAGAFLVIAGGASSGGNSTGTYTVQLDNAFGLVTGADFKVAGVRAGTIKSIDLDQKTLHALVKIQVTQTGFGQFHSDVTCDSRPQSLIGEYFLECQPGNSGPVLKPGSVIPVSHTSTTIAADLLNNIMRMPVRERLTLIINELGAGLAGRSQDLQAALRRAVPALTQTDNLLKLLADDSKTLQDLTSNSDSVVTALSNNRALVQRFIVEANNAATHTAAQNTSLQATFHKLPAFLEQLQPAMLRLGQTADANAPALSNLNASSSEFARLLKDLVPFSSSSAIAIKSLGQASVTGTQAVTAAGPTVAHLNTFAKQTPELGQNLAIVLRDLDNRSRAVERDTRSPGGRGYTGLEALLVYVFNQTLAINTFGPFGHQLAVDSFIDPQCAPYSTPGTIALALAKYGPSYRHCYGWLGPNQPGVNVTDPSNPNGACPDPGGAPPGHQGPTTTCRKLTAAEVIAANPPTTTTPAAASDTGAAVPTSSSTAAQGQSGSGSAAGTSGSGGSLTNTIGALVGLLGGKSGSSAPASGSSSSSASAPSSSSSTSSASAPSTGSAQGGGTQDSTQQLLNYLLAP